MKNKFSMFFAAAALCLAAGAASAEPGTAVITHLNGEAEIVRDGRTLPAELGMAVSPRDVVRTRPGATADFSMNGKVGVRVLADTEAEVSETGEQSMRVNVRGGNVILNLDELPEKSSFELETPTAIASVRGTQFWGRVDIQQPDAPVTTFAVREGAVEVLAKEAGRTYLLNQGEALDIPRDAAAVPSVRPALEAEMQAMEQATTIRTSA